MLSNHLKLTGSSFLLTSNLEIVKKEKKRKEKKKGNLEVYI
jgi:hypothetical protein